jgi:hypothetical protein
MDRLVEISVKCKSLEVQYGRDGWSIQAVTLSGMRCFGHSVDSLERAVDETVRFATQKANQLGIKGFTL